MANNLFFKNDSGDYIPFNFESITTKEWNDKIVIIRVGAKDDPASKNDANQLAMELENLEVLNSVHASYLILDFGIKFETYCNVDELKDKNVYIWVEDGDDLNKLGTLAKEAKQALKKVSRKAVLLPTPLTVEQFAEINEIKKRLDVVKKRRIR